MNKNENSNKKVSAPETRKYKVTFYGREVGAIGRFGHFCFHVLAENENEARMKVYDTHEHLTNFRAEPAQTEGNATQNPRQETWNKLARFASEHAPQSVVLTPESRKRMDAALKKLEASATSEGNAPREDKVTGKGLHWSLAQQQEKQDQLISATMLRIAAEDELERVNQQRDRLLAAAKRVEAAWPITKRKNLASAMPFLREAIATAEQEGK